MPLLIARFFRWGGKYGIQLAAVLFGIPSFAQLPSWHDGAGGATKDYYHRAARLKWQNRPADWLDREGIYGGSEAWGGVLLHPTNKRRTISIDITDGVHQWLAGEVENQGFLLKLTSFGGPVVVSSRESGESHGPRLFVKGRSYSKTLYAKYDTYLDSSTVKSLGALKTIKISSSKPALLWFDLESFTSSELVTSAVLQLELRRTYGSKPMNVGVFLAAPGGNAERDPVSYGLAQYYDGDKGIGSNPSVLYAELFEDSSWKKKWTNGDVSGKSQAGKSGHYSPFQGDALKATLKRGKLTGLNLRYKFGKNSQSEPESAYFRYYVRLGNNWDQTVSGGKFPGFAGTYNRAGWGGRKSNGQNGWSARGSFYRSYSAIGDEPKRATPIGSYVYHLGQYGDFGSNWSWGLNGGASLEKNRWYCIEQYLKLNTPGEKNGILMAWFDGRKVFEKEGLAFRNTRELKIEEVWLNFYHGGTKPSPHEQTMYIDNLVIATEYIGPIGNNLGRGAQSEAHHLVR